MVSTRTPQSPLGSGFGAASTAAEVIDGIDLAGKIAIVTGGYSGIGVETVRALRSAGADVIVPTRDLSKAARTLEGIDGVQIEPMDLMDPASIIAFADGFLASGRPLHLLINNAGIMANPLTRDARGYESQFSTNHLGHFQLANRLWPALVQAGGARIVSLSSWGHRFSPVVFEDPNFERREYDRFAAYGQSKTANILFAVEADERGKADGIRAFAVHPGGIIGTGLDKHISIEELRAFGAVDEAGKPIVDPSRNLKNVEQGAATSVWFATSPLLHDKGGVYGENCDISSVTAEVPVSMQPDARDRTMDHGVMAYAIDPENAKRLWRLSADLLK